MINRVIVGVVKVVGPMVRVIFRVCVMMSTVSVISEVLVGVAVVKHLNSL